MKCVFVNVQTTGLDARSSEIVELAAMPWDDGKSGPIDVDQFRAIGRVSDDIAKINGYDDKARETCATFRHGFVERLLAMLANHENVLVACNPTFVWDFISTAAERMGVPLPSCVRLVDVSSMAVPLYVAGKVGGLGLADLGKIVGRAPKSPGQAADKVELTRDVFEKLFALYYGALK